MKPRTLKTIAAMLALSVAGMSGSASGATLESPSFSVPPMIILWAANDATGAAPVAVDFVVEADNGAETDLIAANGRTLVHRSLVPTADAVSSIPLGSLLLVHAAGIVDTAALTSIDAFSANSGLDMAYDDPRIQTSYYAASNTGFNISATAMPLVQTGDFDLSHISYDIRVLEGPALADGLSWGASNRGVAALGVTRIPETNLAALNGTDVLQIANSTAESPGSIADQSVRIESRYWFDDEHYNLFQGYGEIQAEVSYIAYVP